MTTRRIILAMALLASFGAHVFAEMVPPSGEFTGYYFLDRWNQGVFGPLFVSPDLHKALKQSTWCPIRIKATDIYQPMNPGGAIIRSIASTIALPPPRIKIQLDIDKPVLSHGSLGILTVSLTSAWDKPIDLYRRELDLAITVHKRGVIPEGKPYGDGIFDSFNNCYIAYPATGDLCRATYYGVTLFTDDGDICMQNGSPRLIIQKNNESKSADLYDEDKRTLMPGETLAFHYSVGEDWLINEYELQAQYYSPEDIGGNYTLSKPLSLDVVAPEKQGQQSGPAYPPQGVGSADP